MNILLAEDEKAMSMAISAVLTHSGYTAILCKMGRKLSKRLRKSPMTVSSLIL